MTAMTVSWVDATEVGDALGTGVPDDDVFLDSCTAAANAYAYRRRREAGYVDLPDESPGPDASMGVTIYAVALYRERGSVDSYASFEEFSTGIVPQSTFGQVNRLLGVPKPAIDRAPGLDELVVLRARRYAAGIW